MLASELVWLREPFQIQAREAQQNIRKSRYHDQSANLCVQIYIAQRNVRITRRSVNYAVEKRTDSKFLKMGTRLKTHKIQGISEVIRHALSS